MFTTSPPPSVSQYAGDCAVSVVSRTHASLRSHARASACLAGAVVRGIRISADARLGLPPQAVVGADPFLMGRDITFPFRENPVHFPIVGKPFRWFDQASYGGARSGLKSCSP